MVDRTYIFNALSPTHVTDGVLDELKLEGTVVVRSEVGEEDAEEDVGDVQECLDEEVRTDRRLRGG